MARRQGFRYYVVKNTIFYDGIMPYNYESKRFIELKLNKINGVKLIKCRSMDESINNFVCRKEDVKKLSFEVKYVENLGMFELTRNGRTTEYVEIDESNVTKASIKMISKKIECISGYDKGKVLAYTDGSHKPHERTYKYGMYIKFPNGYQNCISGTCKGNKSMNGSLAGEIQAVIECLSYVYSKGYKEIIIHYDCETLVQWLPKENESTIRFSKMRKIYSSTIKEFEELGIKIEFVKVKAHSDDEKNDFADKIANLL